MGFDSVTQGKVIGVIVTYFPSIGPLSNLLATLSEQVDSVVVVDNGSPANFRTWLSNRESANVHEIYLGENCGIAAAHNIGIKWAKERGANCVLLLDQDSSPAPDMVLRLVDVVQARLAEGNKVAAVGPRYIDERNQERPSFSRLVGLSTEKILCDNDEDIILSDFVISSGALIPLSTLDEVGGMMEGLFIDQIDMEWCLRAKSLGYQSYGVCAARMHHALGEDPISFLGYKLLNHSPLRHYYIFRNAVLLLFKPYIPSGWKLFFVRRLALRFGFYSLMVSPRLSYLKMMSLGIWHGLLGRMGAFNQTDS